MRFSHSSSPKHHFQLQKVNEVAPCVEELSACEMSGNCSIWFEVHTGLQCVNFMTHNIEELRFCGLVSDRVPVLFHCTKVKTCHCHASNRNSVFLAMFCHDCK
jgi:hypothetical protein